MKKSALFVLLVSFVCSSAFCSEKDGRDKDNKQDSEVEYVQSNPNAPEIVKDLKDREREIYESLKKGNGKRGVIKSTVTVSDDGVETVEVENVDSK